MPKHTNFLNNRGQ